jgi:TonB family protein
LVTPPPAPDARPVTKPAIAKAPEPEPVKTPEKLTPDDLRPVDRTPAKPPEHKINVDLSQVVHTVPKNTDSAAADAKEQRRLRELRAKAFKSALTSIKANASSATTVEMPGESSVSYANYSAVVKSIYDQAWTAPDDTASDDADTRVSVTIGRDGTVIGAHILTPSGDASVDRSVQRALDRVTFVAPFPDGATEKERNFIINFNLKAKRMLG